MYLMTELVLFSPLIVYACIRVRKLLPGAWIQNAFVICYILLFLGYPIAERLAHGETTGWTRSVMIAGYYCLPYLLYIILSVAVANFAIDVAYPLIDPRKSSSVNDAVGVL